MEFRSTRGAAEGGALAWPAPVEPPRRGGGPVHCQRLVIFYYTWLFPVAMITHAGHVLMAAHFLMVGYLFIWSLIGIDPGPARPPTRYG
jgi:hypothetical protein